MIEALESRIAPAGVITVAIKSGALIVTGDAMDNSMAVIPLGGGTYLLQGTNGTTITSPTGMPITTLSNLPLGGLQVDLGAGNDSFEATGLQVGGATVLNGGEGNDTLVLRNHTNFGAVTINGGAGNDSVQLTGNYITFRSKLTVTDTEGTNTFDADATNTALGSVQITGSPLADDINFGAAFLRAGAVSINMGDGPGKINVSGTVITLGSTFSATFGANASGTAEVLFGGGTVSVAAGFTVAFGATGPADTSISRVVFGGDYSARIGGTLKVTGGLGQTALHMGSRDLSVGGAVTFQPAGNDNLFGIEAETAKLSGDIKFLGGAGQDRFQVDAGYYTASRKSIFSMGAGENSAEIEAGNIMMTAGVQYTGGAGVDSLVLDGYGRYGAINGTFGSGGGQMVVQGIRVEAASVISNAATLAGENFESRVSGFDTVVKGGVSFVGGAGTNLAKLTAFGGSLSVAGDVIVTGGAGDDFVQVSALELRAKSLKVDSGAGHAEVIVDSAQLLLGGIRFRATEGSDSLSVAGDSGAVGLIDVNTGAGTASLSVFAPQDVLRVGGVNFNASNDAMASTTLNLARVIVAGGVNVNTGDGSDAVNIADSTFNGAVLMQTKGGADNIGVDLPDSGIMSTFYKVFSVALGEGDDTLTIGSNTFAGWARFANKVLIDAGGGTDTTDIFNSNFFAVEPVVANSENAT